MSLPIIAILGKAGAGKSTLAEELQRQYGGVCVGWADPLKALCIELTGLPEENVYGPSEKREIPCKTPFFINRASSIIRLNSSSVFRLLDIPQGRAEAGLIEWVDRCQAFEAEHGGLTARFALQQLGTDWGRALDPDLWVKAGINTALKLLGGGYEYTNRKLVYTPGAKPATGIYFADSRFANEVVAVKAVGGIAVGILGQETSGSGHASELGIDAVPRHFLSAIYNNRVRDLVDLRRFVNCNHAVVDLFQ